MPYPPVPASVALPDDDELLDQLTNAVMNDGSPGFPTSCPQKCEVEPDGQCPHGHPSWLRRYRLI